LLHGTAFGSCVLGFAWLALAMPVHWQQVRGALRLTRRRRIFLRVLGILALAASFALSLSADRASMAPLVWIMALAAGALTVALTLAWRPRWLRFLAGPAGARSESDHQV
jgi:hypothetical protein